MKIESVTILFLPANSFSISIPFKHLLHILFLSPLSFLVAPCLICEFTLFSSIKIRCIIHSGTKRASSSLPLTPTTTAPSPAHPP